MSWRHGQAYSQHLRDRVLAASDGGMRVGQVAQRFAVSVSYVSKVLSRRRLTGETSARRQCCHLGRKLADLHDAIGAEVARRPDVTLQELRTWLRKTHKASVSLSLMWTTLDRLGLTLKKSRSMPRNRSGPTSPRPAETGVRASQA